MAKFNDKISTILNSQLPEFVVSDHPKFKDFLKVYYQLLESAELSFSSIQEGERKAISEFNKKNKIKISDIGELAEQLSTYWKKWIFLGKRIKCIYFFRNKLFNKKVSQILG